MVLSYSAIAQPSPNTPIVISIASTSNSATTVPAPAPVAGSSSTSASGSTSTPIAGPSSTQTQPQAKSDQIQHLILDAGPLLSLTPLRHLATSFKTTPSVLAELRDPKAREHWERLALTGVEVKVEPPSADAMAKVIAFAKKTGDFAVLSQTDLSVIALTYMYEVRVNGEKGIRTEPGQRKGVQQQQQQQEVQDNVADAADEQTGAGEAEDEEDDDEEDGGADAAEQEQSGEGSGVDEITQSIEQVLLPSEESVDETTVESSTNTTTTEEAIEPITTSSADAAEDEDEESDGGEWINPSNLKTHRSRDLGLSTPDGKAGVAAPSVACMTGDYAVQNVLLGMGLGLVGEGGKRISKVRSWVLRCHACFKICKDSSKRFCPSCGNATLLRTSISTNAKTGAQTIHLKKNFQYHLKGSKYSIPEPKMGRAKGQQKGGSGLILREDQREWSDAVRSADIKRQKEERRVQKGVLEGWNDPDWLPEIITVGMSGKGRSNGGGMPTIGHGRKNPNQARRKR